MAASGCAALIYEIVWLQLLQLVIGSSAVSLGLLLAAYMGGLCAGSALLARFVPPDRNPLRVYAGLEAGIGILGFAVLFGIPIIGRLYLAGPTGLIARGLVAAVSLLPPTLLMGASLPAVARWVGTSRPGISRMGFLYSANIAGAVAGCLIAGFYLLRVFDMATATYAAAALNALVALGAMLLARAPVNQRSIPRREPKAPVRVEGARLVYTAIALSGLTALGAEVVWTRLLSLLLGPTVYTFSIILAVFLLGLWGGSSAGSSLARRVENPRLALALSQVVLASTLTWTAYTLAHSLPFWPVDPWLSLDPWFNFELDLARATWAILPATLLWGAGFPLALASVTAGGEDPARIAGKVYAVNTAGSIIGSLAFSLWLIPAVGSRQSQQVLIAVAAIAAVFAAASVPEFGKRRLRVIAAAACVELAGWGLAATVEDVPWQVIAYGRRMAPIVRAFDLYDRANPTKVLFRGEGVNSSVLIAERAGQRHFYVSGKAEASTAILDMRLERMMGHVPALIHPAPHSALVVGFGAGVTAGSLTRYPELRSLTICELEPFIPPASTEFFGKENYDVLHDPRTRMVYDDARHYIFTTREKFDVITTDPIHPWVKGTSVLYSKEYYQLVKQHLNSGGVVAQWLPIYDSDPETIKTELATFFAVFPEGTVWSNNLNGDGFDLVLLGQAQPQAINIDAIQARLDHPSYSPVLQSLSDVGFHSAVELLATYAGRARELQPMMAGAQINEDLNMRLQYIAGLGLNSMAYQQTYKTILKYRRFPEDLLVGAPGGRMDALRTLLR
ncbi:MAG: SAM-dependent methyltransferase [Bryobacterales bacterium]|nr:SAM-dependent methyltransferase [Bryobacterales bacterium]MBV9399939.1 SAM-dependent methyltransferase [Bryobacterales bacterium]